MLLAAAGDRVPLLRGPAPYPPEWQWPLRDAVPPGPVWPAVLAAGALVLLLALSGSSPWRSRPLRASRILLSAASVLGAAFALTLLAPEPDGVLPTLLGRVAYRTATSYYTVALSPEAADPLEFLRHHHELLAGFRKGAKHAATHPPGPVLAYRGLLAVCARAPGLTRAVLRAAGLPESNPRRPRPELDAPARAAGVLGGLAILVACVLTAWPIAALGRGLGCGALEAARLGTLWTLLPGPVLMLPQFDQALALPVTLSAAALARALRADGQGRGLSWAALAGLFGAVALAFSYGAPAFLALGGLAVLAAALARGLAPAPAIGRCAVAAGVTAALFAAPALAGHHPVASALEALRIHREFFTRPREYGVWLAFDPLDLAVFLGAPVAVSLVLATAHAVGRVVRRESGTAPTAFRLGAMGVLVALVLSGQTRGEVGRIWIPIMPVLLVAALARPAQESEGGPTAGEAVLLALLLVPMDLVLALSWKFF